MSVSNRQHKNSLRAVFLWNSTIILANWLVFDTLPSATPGRGVESVDTKALKSFEGNLVRVRVPPRPPSFASFGSFGWQAIRLKETKDALRSFSEEGRRTCRGSFGWRATLLYTFNSAVLFVAGTEGVLRLVPRSSDRSEVGSLWRRRTYVKILSWNFGVAGHPFTG